LLQVDSDDVLPVALRRSPEARALLSALTGETPLTERPVLRLADGRRVRLLAVRSAAAEGGRLTLTFQTEGRE
ncbi:MAG TPA: hypothetical protein VD963_01155, partial [Phycisphaerales bacterium]|nr:hypothetical protein [Phycisphaerales bacterium]